MTRKPKTRVTPHVFQPGPADEADQSGRVACTRCGLVGEPGDAHHTLPEPSMDARSMAAGEGGEG